MVDNTDATDEVIETEVIVDSQTTSETEHEKNTEEAVSPESEPDWFKQRINKVTAQKYDAIAEAKKAAEEAEQLRSEKAELEQRLNTSRPVESVKSPELRMPSEDLKYDDLDEYERQFVAFQQNIARQTFEEQQRAAQEAERQRAQQKAFQEAQAGKQRAILASAEKHEIDVKALDDAVGTLNRQGINPQLAEMIIEHEASAPLFDYLAKNPADFDMLNTLNSPLAVARELDKLQPNALKRKVTSAPSPVEALKGGPSRETTLFEQVCPKAVFK